MDKQTWKEKLGDKIPAELGREIDIFEQQMELRKQGKIDEKVFAETRLRRGIYGQRYDNGQRHDGKRVQKLKLSRRRDQRAGYLVGRAGDDAHQDSVRRRDAGAVGNARRSVRRVCRRRVSCDDAAGFSVSLRPHRRHARLSCAASPRSASRPRKPAATSCATSPLARWRVSAMKRHSTRRLTPRLARDF